ncbi:MAG: thioredoxin domain-containing protein, partial [Bacteroidia bacterium]|nr:thioredoxin domain-containing protein [Bacteroidia bacterium]
WKVPHFEKMLYDNAQLISLYSNAYQISQNPIYKSRVKETIEFVRRNKMSPAGGIFSSFDADSENQFGHKEEGSFYVWNKDEIVEVLGASDKTEAFCSYFQITDKGNWEDGKNIPYINSSINAVATEYGMKPEDLKDFIDQSKDLLLEYRNQRPKPGLDDKVLTSWNALYLHGLVDAFRVFGEDEYYEDAISVGKFLKNEMLQSDGRLNRNYKDGKSVINAFLEDYALLSRAFVGLYQITFDESWLYDANLICEYAIEHFFDSNTGMFTFTSKLDAPLAAKTIDYSDNVIPGSNSSMARALYELGILFNDGDKMDKAKQMLHNVMPTIEQADDPGFFSNWLSLYLDVIDPPYEIAILGQGFRNKLASMQANYIPNALYIGGIDEGTLDLLKDKLVEDETIIYVCQNKVCKLPTSDVNTALKLIE